MRRRTHPHAHSAFVYGPIDLFGREEGVDVMIEAKAMELALLMYRDEILPLHAQQLHSEEERGAAAVEQRCGDS